MVTREGPRPQPASAEQRLIGLGMTLPAPPEPFGTYVEAVQTGHLLFLSGMLPTEGRAAKVVGRVGAELDVAAGRKAALAISGMGIGLIVPAMTSAMLGSVEKSWSGIASGTLTTFRQTGSVLGVALFGSLLAGMGATAGRHTACALAVGLMLVVAVLLCMAGEQSAT